MHACADAQADGLAIRPTATQKPGFLKKPGFMDSPFTPYSAVYRSPSRRLRSPRGGPCSRSRSPLLPRKRGPSSSRGPRPNVGRRSLRRTSSRSPGSDPRRPNAVAPEPNPRPGPRNAKPRSSPRGPRPAPGANGGQPLSRPSRIANGGGPPRNGRSIPRGPRGLSRSPSRITNGDDSPRNGAAKPGRRSLRSRSPRRTNGGGPPRNRSLRPLSSPSPRRNGARPRGPSSSSRSLQSPSPPPNPPGPRGGPPRGWAASGPLQNIAPTSAHGSSVT
jgi:hypothetical protein